jgi:hypothetical protein
MPLKALLNGTPFFAWDLGEEHRGLGFLCPHCDSKLVPVLPRWRIKHFRHYNGHYHGEPETPEHEEGKKLLYDALSSFGEARLEERIGENIADVALRSPQGRTAVEYQCSPISLPEFDSRNLNYARNGFRPLWILGTHYWDHGHAFFEHSRGYRIQRLTALEERIMEIQPLLYLYRGRMYIASWKPRFRSEWLGWYRFAFLENGKEVLEGLVESSQKAREDLLLGYLVKGML